MEYVAHDVFVPEVAFIRQFAENETRKWPFSDKMVKTLHRDRRARERC
jgi:hypothetical protein